MTRANVCIIAFTVIAKDARVLRQIQYLSRDYAVTVIGLGDPHPDYPDVRWLRVEPAAASRITRLWEKGVTLITLVLARLIPDAYVWWYFSRSFYQRVLKLVLATNPQIIHANDWETLPLAVAAAKTLNAKVVFDVHEYAPLEKEDDPRWLLLEAPRVTHLLRRFAPRAAASITVCQPIADRYAREFKFAPIVVMNAPPPVDLAAQPVDPAHIELVHHGIAAPNRKIEWMIEAAGLADARYHLHLYLLGDAAYLAELRAYADRVAPGRVTLHPALPVSEIVPTINAYDIGVHLFAPANYSYEVSLPNKFFDFINARLMVCIPPSPAMADLVNKHGFGCVLTAYSPLALADQLNRLSAEDITALKQAAHHAARLLNGDVEMAKVTRLYRDLVAKTG